MHEAAKARADWLVLPEMFLGGYQLEAVAEIALAAEGPELAGLAAAARELGVGIQVGFAERNGGLPYNAVLMAPPRGESLVYRKAHLFGRESGAYSPGNALAVLETGGVCLAPLICYDLEFPEPVRAVALQGAQLILVSTADMEPYGEQGELFARVRALENRVFVAVANRIGEESGYRFFGGCILTGPNGEVIAKAGSTETLLVADCDLSLCERAKADGDYLRDRRPELVVK
jgi:predicted amidohydrolase